MSLAEKTALRKKELEEKIALRSIVIPNDDAIIVRALNKMREVPSSSAEKRAAQLKWALYSRKRKNLPYNIESILDDNNEMDIEEEYWSVGTKDLLLFRKNLAHRSLNLSKKRLDLLKKCSLLDLSDLETASQSFLAECKQLQPISSSSVSERPITALSLRQESNLILVGDMGGKISLNKVENDELVTVYTAENHNGRLSDVKWIPYADLSDTVAHFASCGNDGKIYFYNVESNDPFSEITAHSSRCNRINFITQSHFLTCGFDKLIKLWDTASEACILEQPGHNREVYTISVHPDKSLMYSGDLEGIGRAWDLRTGRVISLLQDDHKGILTSLWHPNGFWLFTAGEDCVVRIYDIRQLKKIYEIPAHTQNISHMQLLNTNLDSPNALLTASFDQSVKIWSENNWKLEFSEDAHDGKITSADWNPTSKQLYTGGFDRVVKLWDVE